MFVFMTITMFPCSRRRSAQGLFKLRFLLESHTRDRYCWNPLQFWTDVWSSVGELLLPRCWFNRVTAFLKMLPGSTCKTYGYSSLISILEAKDCLRGGY